MTKIVLTSPRRVRPSREFRTTRIACLIILSSAVTVLTGGPAAGSTIVLTSPNDTSDSRPMIHAALDATHNRLGGVVHLEKGDYYVNSSLNIGNNTHLRLDPDAKIIRRFTGGGQSQGTICNKDQSAGNTNIHVSGGEIKAESSPYSGKHLSFVKVTSLKVDQIRFTSIYVG